MPQNAPNKPLEVGQLGGGESVIAESLIEPSGGNSGSGRMTGYPSVTPWLLTSSPESKRNPNARVIEASDWRGGVARLEGATYIAITRGQNATR